MERDADRAELDPLAPAGSKLERRLALALGLLPGQEGRGTRVGDEWQELEGGEVRVCGARLGDGPCGDLVDRREVARPERLHVGVGIQGGARTRDGGGIEGSTDD